jgi:hypothetical protein
MWGQRFLWLWITATLICGAIDFHTRAPLATLHCRPYEQQTNNQTSTERCTTFDIRFARSADDLWGTIGGFIHRNRDDITAISTLIIAIFTGTLWWVTGGMVSIAKDQRLDMLRSIKVSEDAAEAAKIAAEASRIQSETSQLTLIATFRPRLVIRRISLDSEEIGKPLKVQWIVANIGGTPGKIIDSNCTILIRGAKILEPIPEYDGQNAMGSVTVEPGISYLLSGSALHVCNRPTVLHIFILSRSFI